MHSTNCYCLRCQQPITEIDRHGEPLRGCQHCNIWWTLGSLRAPPKISVWRLIDRLKRSQIELSETP
jgi:hypothetical protein